MQCPTTTTTSSAPPCHLPSLLSTSISDGAPKSTPSGLILYFWPSAPSPASHLQTQRPTTTTTSLAPLHHLPLPLSTPISDGTPEIEPQWLGFGFLALN